MGHSDQGHQTRKGYGRNGLALGETLEWNNAGSSEVCASDGPEEVGPGGEYLGVVSGARLATGYIRAPILLAPLPRPSKKRCFNLL